MQHLYISVQVLTNAVLLYCARAHVCLCRRLSCNCARLILDLVSPSFQLRSSQSYGGSLSGVCTTSWLQLEGADCVYRIANQRNCAGSRDLACVVFTCKPYKSSASSKITTQLVPVLKHRHLSEHRTCIVYSMRESVHAYGVSSGDSPGHHGASPLWADLQLAAPKAHLKVE